MSACVCDCVTFYTTCMCRDVYYMWCVCVCVCNVWCMLHMRDVCVSVLAHVMCACVMFV